MRYRELGRSGLMISELGLGCNSFGTRIDYKAAEKVIHYAIDQGVNFFDTANSYANGLSEQYLGKALKNRRPEAIIATKFGWENLNSNTSYKKPNHYGASRYNIMKAVDESLLRLKTDHIDLYQIHCPDPNTPIEETLHALDYLIKIGKVRYIGCCNFDGIQLSNAMQTIKNSHLEAFISVQELYNLIDRDIERELVPSYLSYGLGLIPFEPLRNGFLTGKYKRGEGIPKDSHYYKKPESIPKGFLSNQNFEILEKLEDFAIERNHSIGDLALAWLISKPYVSSVIAGSTKLEQVRANIKGIKWKLTTEEANQINHIL